MPLLTTILFVIAAAPAAPDAQELTRLLKEFLAGAGTPGAAVHERFWADDLIYTGSSGRRIGKTDILGDVRSAPAPRPGDPEVTYSAEDIRIQQYGNTALVAFRLVATTKDRGKSEVARYLNTGTFLKRNGKWQAVGWQATKMPPSDDEARRDVAAAEAGFHRAMLAADTTTLAALTDQGFVWTHRSGERMTRRRLLEELGAGTLQYSALSADSMTVSIHGETAIARGVSRRQRSAFVTGGVSGKDAPPFVAYYTLTFVRDGGGWKAVAMHTSRP